MRCTKVALPGLAGGVHKVAFPGLAGEVHNVAPSACFTSISFERRGSKKEKKENIQTSQVWK